MATERALEILRDERDKGRLDGDLLALFEHRHIWELAHRDMDEVRAAIDRMLRGQEP